MAEIFFTDSFEDDRAPGNVVGRLSKGGIMRRGIDVEKRISADNGALRIAPPIRPGWGRTGISYGPYLRRNGLMFLAYVLNGHNASEYSSLPETLPRRIHFWATAGGTTNLAARLWRWAMYGRKRVFVDHLRRWYRIDAQHRAGAMPQVDENLAVGWFSSENPPDPVRNGNGFAIHSSGPENGEIWARIGPHTLRAVSGVQNLPICYAILLRDKGAAYYVGSLPGARGFAQLPALRPLAIDPFDQEQELFAGIHQSTLGQIGFRVDTRIHRTQVASIAEFSNWYGTAQAADNLTGRGELGGSHDELGLAWRSAQGRLLRTATGVISADASGMALVTPTDASGLIHFVTGRVPAGAVGLLWRVQDAHNYWELEVSAEQACACIWLEGERLVVYADRTCTLDPANANSLQILDDGSEIAMYVNGRLLAGRSFADGRLDGATAVGFRVQDPDGSGRVRVRDFEAHPRAVPIPCPVTVPDAWTPPEGRISVVDDFKGEGDLDGHTTTRGSKTWRRAIGTGTIMLEGAKGALVQGSVAKPNPGRTAYLIDWNDHRFADLEVDIIPPGTDRGQAEWGRGGLMFYMDSKNYLIVSTWLDDSYRGASIVSFFCGNGFEDIYDAVWTNVGKRIYWGIPYRLRVVFDGMNYEAFVDNEPVLFRRLNDIYPDCPPMAIRRVGIVANWEFGNDTGSRFRNFVGSQTNGMRGADMGVAALDNG